MADFLSDLLLRETTRPGIAAKGDELTYGELDKNIYAIAEMLHALAYASVAGLPAYNPLTIYTGGETVYVSYGSLAWEFVSLTNRSGVTPGTNDAVWLKAPISKFAHAADYSGIPVYVFQDLMTDSVIDRPSAGRQLVTRYSLTTPTPDTPVVLTGFPSGNGSKLIYQIFNDSAEATIRLTYVNGGNLDIPPGSGGVKILDNGVNDYRIII